MHYLSTELEVLRCIYMQTSKSPLQEAIDGGHVEVTKLLMKVISEANKKVGVTFLCILLWHVSSYW